MKKPIILASCLILALLVFFPVVPISAGDAPPQEETAETAVDDEMKPTEIGIRFTPGMAKAFGNFMSRQMKSQYDLDDNQVQEFQNIMAHQIMRLAQDNAETGRGIIEYMLEASMANGGSFSKEAAMKFAKMSKPIMPALKKFFTDSSAAIGKRMTLKQRLKLTGDMAKIAAGLAVFENRMKRWEEGKTGDFANPFYDSDDNVASTTDADPEDPNESPEHRKVRHRVEGWIDNIINVDNGWDDYVNQAIAYYTFDDSQTAAAKAIMRECKQRAEPIKTPEFRRSIKEITIIQQMVYRMEYQKNSKFKTFNNGPWMYQLELSKKKLLKPLNDLETELKHRIEGVPTSQQRAAAKERIRKLFSEKGVKKLPF